jgi:hypothetical protein
MHLSLVLMRLNPLMQVEKEALPDLSIIHGKSFQTKMAILSELDLLIYANIVELLCYPSASDCPRFEIK